MSGYKLFTYQRNYRAWKALISSEYVGVEIEVPEFVFGKDNKTPEFKAKNPLGKVPTLETPHGCIWESGAIARYVASLRSDAQLFGDKHFQYGLVNQWVEFGSTELEGPRSIWLYPIHEIVEYDEEAYQRAKADVFACLKVLNDHLLKRTFLVGNHVTLADICIVAALVDLYAEVLPDEYAKNYPNVKRWFELCLAQKEFAKHIGNFKFATEEKKAKASGKEEKKSDDKAKSKKDDKPKDKKDDKPKDAKKDDKPKDAKKDEGKGKKDDGKGKKDDKPKDAKKDEGKGKKDDGKGKKDDGKGKKDDKAKDDKGKKAEKDDTENLEDAAEQEEKEKKKVKNPLDLLPESPMILDAQKKSFFSQKPYNPGFWTEFWKIFDSKGYSIYTIAHLYDQDNKLLYMTGNLIGGFLQRAEDCRKYAFGVLNIIGEDEENPPFKITGCWIFRGVGIPKEMKECPDSDSYTWTQVNTDDTAARKTVEDLFVADKFNKDKVLDRRYFK